LLEKAIAAHRKGAIEAAAVLYRKVLTLDPRNDVASSNLAVIAATRGDLALAEELFRQAVKFRPGDAKCHHNLGSLLQQRGRSAEAVTAHQRAVALKSDYYEAYFGLGNALKLEGRLDEALAAYRHAIALRPDHAEAFNNIGVVLQQQRKSDLALAAYERATELRPAYAEAHFNLGVALQDIGKPEDAAAAYRQVIALRPDIAAAYNNLGAALQELGRHETALAAYAAAIERSPDYAEAHYNRGVMLQALNRPAEALAAYRTAVALKPGYIEAINNAGVVLQVLGRHEDASLAHRQVIALSPDHAEACNNLGAALLAQSQFHEALAALQRALAIKPDYPEAFYNMGNAWRELGKLEGSVATYQKALQLQPDYADAFSQLAYHRWRACDWTDYEASQNRLLDMVRRRVARVPPFYLLSTPASPADQFACAQQWIAPLLPPAGEMFHHAPSEPRPRIRLGYLSGDFHEHATADLTAELFERHDRSRFEVVAYSYGRGDGSPMRRRLERAFDRFVDIAPLSHRAAAARVHQDGIDILVDLKGYTYHARPQIMAHRPAAVQVNYLGYPATMGADFIDYIIVDSFVVPGDQQPFFAERLVHLPGCYQANDTRRHIPAAAPSRTDCGLPRDAFVFCCFNNSYKITPAFFDIWMRLLDAIRGSVLWLLAPNDLVMRNLRREAERRGVDPDRLVFAAIVPRSEHLSRHRNADLFLDTLPCNAHTTASDALWAGLPILTCAGATFAGRVAASLLTDLGLPQLITSSPADYERTARELAREPQRLLPIRDALAQRRDQGTLFDCARLARRLEAAYLRMWESRCGVHVQADASAVQCRQRGVTPASLSSPGQ
jgi:predicted O-linked N-acetylglucosamine transferase (SPINDLY family)